MLNLFFSVALIFSTNAYAREALEEERLSSQESPASEIIFLPTPNDLPNSTLRSRRCLENYRIKFQDREEVVKRLQDESRRYFEDNKLPLTSLDTLTTLLISYFENRAAYSSLKDVWRTIDETARLGAEQQANADFERMLAESPVNLNSSENIKGTKKGKKTLFSFFDKHQKGEEKFPATEDVKVLKNFSQNFPEVKNQIQKAFEEIKKNPSLSYLEKKEKFVETSKSLALACLADRRYINRISPEIRAKNEEILKKGKEKWTRCYEQLKKELDSLNINGDNFLSTIHKAFTDQPL